VIALVVLYFDNFKGLNLKKTIQKDSTKINLIFSCYTSSIADRLLQQCLVPVLPNARELNMGAW
jgi:hypothetical protein